MKATEVPRSSKVEESGNPYIAIAPAIITRQPWLELGLPSEADAKALKNAFIESATTKMITK